MLFCFVKTVSFFQTFRTGAAVDVSPLNPSEDTVDVASLVYFLVASRAVPREQLVPELREDLQGGNSKHL